MTGRTNLHTLQQALADDQLPLPQEIRSWLADGVEAYLDAGEKIPLCRCLGIRGPGIRHRDTEMARLERNIALREAYDLMPRHGDESDRAVSERLATLVRRFESVTWPRCRHMDEAPPHFDEMQRVLFHAFRHGMGCGGVPGSGRHLRGIVT